MTLSGWSLGQGIGWALTHSVWQAGVLTVALTLVLRALPTSLATFRYRLALSTMALAVTIPLLTALGLALDWHGHRSCRDGITDGVEACAGHGRPPATAAQGAKAAEGPTTRTSAPAAGSPSRLGAIIRATAVPGARLLPASARTIVRKATGLMGWITLVWMAGVTLSAFVLARSLRSVQRLWRRAGPVTDIELHKTLSDALASADRRVAVEVRATREVTSPAATWGRPGRVLLPVDLTGLLNPAELQAVLAHELAHLRGRDPAIGVAQALACSVFFFNPFVLALSRVTDREREALRDAQAAEGLGSRLRYAETLLALAGFQSCVSRVGVQALAGEGNLVGRVRRLGGSPIRPDHARGRKVAAGALGIGIVVLLITAGATAGMLSSWAVMVDADDVAARSASTR